MSVLSYEEILGKLNNVHKRGGALVAQCPVCGDEDHLYINQDGEKTLAFCHKCHASLPAVLKALDVGGEPPAPVAPLKPKDHGKRIERIVYTYRDPYGKEAYCKIREKFADGHKKFSFLYTGPDGTVIYKKPKPCNNLYNLDRLTAAKKTETLYIVEGEKCADAMTNAGFLATSTNTGAESPNLSETDRKTVEKFTRKVIIPDNDGPGAVYGKAWEARGAKVLPLPEIWPECPVKGDVADYLEQGGDPEKIREYRFPTAEFSEEYFRNLDRADLISEDFLLKLIQIDDPVQQQRAESLATFRASDLSIKREFCKNLQAARIKLAQERKENENVTRFTGQALALRCGDWIADDEGVRRMTAKGNNGDFTYQWASRIPTLPTGILVNAETGEERIRLDFYKAGKWSNVTADRSDVASKNRIVNLANNGLEVTTDNAQNLVKYISECVTENPADMPRETFIDHFGWTEDGGFAPYVDGLTIDAGPTGDALVNAIKQKGTLDEWLKIVRPLMDNIYLRLTVAASLAAPLLEIIKGLPYVFHLWGGTGSGKTVGIMVAASVWGNPQFGAMVRTMNMTDNALVGVASTLRNIPFFGDELQTIKDRFNGYDRLLYRITEKTGRARMTADRRVEKPETWNTGFVFTGEEPVTGENSGGGVKNRVIEIECDGPVVEHGNQVVRAINEHYGTLGPEFIKKALQVDVRAAYDLTFQELMETGTTDKQAMTMALLMVADDIFRIYFLKSEIPGLMPADVAPFLLSKKQVDVSERAYSAVIDWIAENTDKFFVAHVDDAERRDCDGRIWGGRSGNEVSINRSVLMHFMADEGFNFTAVKKKWAATGKIVARPDGRVLWTKSICGAKASYVVLVTGK
ncbi:DUF927 domain-containing protein [Acidaminococcus provencensis]|uniref:DUF927 domain-containing protein n=1 Tax=Acidaminococcus provencensis TaxID=2058289 RepID=UPI0022E0DD59|nr:DUF927 domain-containing protein [Acidaminococcus provencensis]